MTNCVRLKALRGVKEFEDGTGGEKGGCVRKMSFFRSTANHGLVVGMKVRVIADFEESWIQRFIDL